MSVHDIFTEQFWSTVLQVSGLITLITETLKHKLHLKDLGAVILSIVVGFVVCAVHVVGQGWDTLYFFYFTVTCVLASNGAFLMVREHAMRQR